MSEGSQRGDKNLTVYAMAVGQGDGNIILCPNGRDIVIVDMGSSQLYANKNYGGYLLKKFGASKNTSIHIVITHPDVDHYSFLPYSFHEDDQLIKSVKEIVLGGRYERYGNKRFQSWFNKTRADVPVYIVNNGLECFNNSECSWTPVSTAAINYIEKPTSDDMWQFCGDDVHITVLGANICGRTCSDNGHSIILKLVYKEWSLFLSGDFEGKDQQKNLINHSQSMLQSTYYKVAHHGAWTYTSDTKANSPELLRAISPKRAYVSSAHPLVSKYSHPRCEIFDHLIKLGSINTTNTCNSIDCCSKSLRHRCYVADRKFGYAIYETCRYYDNCSRCQICQDIEITTDGYSDHTVYRSVPDKYVEPSLKNCQKPLQRYF